MDSWKRTITKTITWRLTAACIAFLILIAATGSAGLSAILTAADFIIKGAMYLAHERAWNRTAWGRMLPQPKGDA